MTTIPTVSTADQQRAWRASKGARTGQPGRPVTAEHGTVAAHRRHRRNGEDPCEACRVAYNEDQRRMYAQRKGRQA